MFSLTMFLSVHNLVKLVLMLMFCLALASQLPPEDLGSSLSILLAASLLLFLIARHEDHLSRMEWLWRERLKGEEEGVETMQGINRVLLENLLPAHVARHFITIIKVNVSQLVWPLIL